ncbi:helix-turn-helix domain-containing protein [Mucilaginibacter agri]|uniref:DNA-binding protein n=1 Tax=Mucilaginibacter agri TaxID=2695265 RepID=A0A965ZBX9_9SPHI|nr:helix-turn-helix domain-containing protein [Mucilaginibacter agri]NCD67880.1 DNA-binding protein [Mucilaginibacter agri]
MTPDELLTKKDLERFKTELFELLKPMVEGGRLVQQKWLRSKDVRDMLGVSHGTLMNFRISGALKFKKVGGIFFYAADDIQKMLSNPEKKSPNRKG